MRLTLLSRTDGPLKPYLKAARVYHIVVEAIGSPISVIYDGMANEFMERAREEGAHALYVVVCAYMHIYLHICASTCIYACLPAYNLADSLCRRLDPEETPDRAREKARNIQLYRKFKCLIPSLDTLLPLFRDRNDALQCFAEAVSFLFSLSHTSDCVRGCGACKQHTQ